MTYLLLLTRLLTRGPIFLSVKNLVETKMSDVYNLIDSILDVSFMK